ncbi:MAG: hypothetical protein M9897_00020 [Brumimicrobium sp.]|nr:hypothetical protein [Brumimicrobium sp.]
MKTKVILFILFLLYFNKGFTQESLIMYIYATNGTEKTYPFLIDPFYDQITYGKNERNTTFFNLKGPVKIVNTTSYYLNADTINGIESAVEQKFNSNLQLVYFKHTTCDLCWTIEDYTYKNGKLLERKTENRQYSDSSRTNYQYNDLGYLIGKEDYFIGKYSHENEVYHYKTKFTYNDSFTSVQYKYYPITKLYDDMKGGKVEFHFDKKGNYKYPNTVTTYDSLNRPVFYHLQNICATANSCLNIMVSTSFDSKGNITEQNVQDFTIRNSNWSFSKHFKAGYDENNLLIWKEFYFESAIFEQTEAINNPYREIYEYTFDIHGNWTTLKIYYQNKLNKLIERKIEYYNAEE